MGVPIKWHGSYVFVPKPKPKSIHVRIVSVYPPAFGLPEETTDLTLELRPEFARTPDEAHRRINEALAGDEVFEIPVVDSEVPVRFSPDVVRMVVVWEG